MKRSGIILYCIAAVALTVACLVSGCVSADRSMSTALRADGSGERVFVVDVPSDSFSDISGGVDALEATLRASLPPAMSLNRTDTGDGAQFAFTMSFANLEDLAAKLSSLAGWPVTVGLQREGTPFAPFYTYSESASAADYFEWMAGVVEYAGIVSGGDRSSYFNSYGTSSFTLLGQSLETDFLSPPFYQWSAPVPISTYDFLTEFSSKWAATRTIRLTVRSADALGMEQGQTSTPVDFLKGQAPEGASVTREDSADQVTYQVRFEAAGVEELLTKSLAMFGTDTITLAEVKEGASAFSPRRAYSETIDAVSWLGFDSLGGGTGTFTVVFPGRIVSPDNTVTDQKSLTQPFASVLAVEALVQQSSLAAKLMVLGIILIVVAAAAIVLLTRREQTAAVYRKAVAALKKAFRPAPARPITPGSEMAAGSAQMAAAAEAPLAAPRAPGAATPASATVRRFASPALFGLVLFMFILPFISFSCEGQEIATLTGYNLAFGTEIQDQAVQSSPQAVVALLLAVAGLVVGLVRFRGHEIAAIVAGLGGPAFLAALKAKADQAAVEAMCTAKGEAGFWLSLLLFVGACGFNVYLLVWSMGPRTAGPAPGLPPNGAPPPDRLAPKPNAPDGA